MKKICLLCHKEFKGGKTCPKCGGALAKPLSYLLTWNKHYRKQKKMRK